SLSTVFERPFLQFPQEFHVIHEPLNPIGCAYVTKNFEFLNQIPLPKPTDLITFVHHFSPTLNEILVLHYYNDVKTHTLRVFAKDHASNFLDKELHKALQRDIVFDIEVLLKNSVAFATVNSLPFLSITFIESRSHGQAPLSTGITPFNLFQAVKYGFHSSKHSILMEK
ncbi:20193_t:CDS:2, partial [Racocetra persica]